MMEFLIDALTGGLTKQQINLLIRVMWRIAVSIFVAWSFGIFATLGFDGYARASDVKELKEQQVHLAQQQNVLQLTLLEQSLFETRIRQCRAESTGEREGYARRMSELKTQYLDLKKAPYDEPKCNEV